MKKQQDLRCEQLSTMDGTFAGRVRDESVLVWVLLLLTESSQLCFSVHWEAKDYHPLESRRHLEVAKVTLQMLLLRQRAVS